MKRIAVFSLAGSLIFLASCIYGIVPLSFNPPADRLGTVWYEEESGWDGIWTRRGNSNVFDAIWTAGNAAGTAVLTITIQDDRVTVIRGNSSNGVNYTYTGTLSHFGSRVSGAYTDGKNMMPWKATITNRWR
jgi:hypothetical protein